MRTAHASGSMMLHLAWCSPAHSVSTPAAFYWLCRRPATASGDSRRCDAESTLSASQQKPEPFITAVKSQPACDKVSDWLNKDSYGQVPNYLVERQIEMAAQLAEEEVGLHHIHSHCFTMHV